MAQESLEMHGVGIFATAVLVEGTNPSRQSPVLESLSEGICQIC